MPGQPPNRLSAMLESLWVRCTPTGRPSGRLLNDQEAEAVLRHGHHHVLRLEPGEIRAPTGIAVKVNKRNLTKWLRKVVSTKELVKWTGPRSFSVRTSNGDPGEEAWSAIAKLVDRMSALDVRIPPDFGREQEGVEVLCWALEVRFNIRHVGDSWTPSESTVRFIVYERIHPDDAWEIRVLATHRVNTVELVGALGL